MPLTKDKKYFIVDAWDQFEPCGKWLRDMFAECHYLIVKPKKGKDRTILQNDKMWPMLTDISNQVEWFGQKHEPEDWKDIITGSLRQGKFVPGIEGGFVVIGLRTSKMTRRVFAGLITYMYSFGAEKGVVWSEQSKSLIEEVKLQRQQEAA